jgi:hypothetical protein
MKIHPVVAELLHVGGREDGHDEAHSSISEFCERAYNQQINVGKGKNHCLFQKPLKNT